MRWPRRLTGTPPLASPVAVRDVLVGSKVSVEAEGVNGVVTGRVRGAGAALAVTVDQVATWLCSLDVSAPLEEAVSSIDVVRWTVRVEVGGSGRRWIC